jgi:hypothetical protein
MEDGEEKILQIANTLAYASGQRTDTFNIVSKEFRSSNLLVSNITRICKECEQLIDETKVWGKGLYCSKSCQRKKAVKSRFGFDTKIQLVKNCNKCGREFNVERKILQKVQLPTKKEKQFCSRGCANSHIFSKETRKKLSDTVKNKLLKGEKVGFAKINFDKNKCIYCNKMHNHRYFCSKSCKDTYYGIHKKFPFKMGGKFYWIVWALDNNIMFERNTEKFLYIFKEKECFYIPDFKIKNGSYLEIKGYGDRKVETKIKQFTKSLEVIYNIVFFKEFVDNKYGKNYINEFLGVKFIKKKICVFCKEEFVSKGKSYKFCSNSCSANYRHTRNKQLLTI